MTFEHLQHRVTAATVLGLLLIASPGYAQSVAPATEAPTTDFGFSDDNPLILQPNERIYMAQGQSVSVNVVAEWADY